MKNDCVGTDGYGDGTKAWKLLQENFCSVERPTVVSLVGQLVKLHPGSEEDLGDYFFFQSRADDAVERSWRSNHGHTIQCSGDKWTA